MFHWEKSSQYICANSVIFNKAPKGENSPNLVTLFVSELKTVNLNCPRLCKLNLKYVFIKLIIHQKFNNIY
jgi:hypothetical protein